MKKPQFINIIPHFVTDDRIQPLPDRIAEFHAQIISLRLDRLGLTVKQKLAVIDQIITNIRSTEIRDIIK